MTEPATTKAWDYIVVGAGSAGCVVAGRLAEAGRSVLLLEAGGADKGRWLEIPLGLGKIIRDARYIWPFETEPDAATGNRRMYWPRGKTLGGSSSVNGMIWAVGDPHRYDEWAAESCPGWDWRAIEPVMRSAESYAEPGAVGRGTAGPIAVQQINGRQPMTDAFIAACVAVGIPATPDYNRGADGVGRLQLSTRRGVRCSTAVAYLRPNIRRPNLAVQTEALVEKVVFAGRTAVGVAYSRRGEFHQATARHEVILAAGAIQSPQLLELSGVGNAGHLRSLGLEIVLDLPEVGENLSDHFHIRSTYRARNVVTVNDLLRRPWLHGPRAWLEYQTCGTGLFANATATAHALARTEPGAPYPDMKIQLHTISSADRTAETAGLSVDRFSGASIGFFQLYPESRGSVHIASHNPSAPPRIVPNYLHASADRAAAVRGLRWCRRIAAEPALRRFLAEESRPGTDIDDDDALLDYARREGQTSYHPVGTCRMGARGTSVVDARGRVHGLQSIRVADASVMPFIVSSNTNAPAIAIGERMASFILAESNESRPGTAAA